MLIEVTKKTVTEEKEMKEISLPYYAKEGTTHYAIIAEGKYMEVDKYGILLWESTYKMKEIASYEPATEAEFVAAYTIARIRTEFNIQPINTSNESPSY